MEAMVHPDSVCSQVSYTHYTVLSTQDHSLSDIVILFVLSHLLPLVPSSYLHSCDPPIIHGNLTCDTIFIQHNGLIKIGSGNWTPVGI